MKILVTGANGLLGSKLSQILMEDETITPILTARNKLFFPVTRGSFVALDITDKANVLAVVATHKPDVIINTAAMTQVDHCEQRQDECWTANVLSMKNLIEACAVNKTHLIQVSTDFIFDGANGPLDEDATPHPVNFYGESKLAAERLIQESSISWSILRTVLVYGITADLSRSNIVVWVKENLENKKQIHVVNDQWRTPTLAEDLAIGCFLAAKKKAKGIFNISGKDFMSPYDIAIRTAAFFNLDVAFITATDSTKFTQPAKRPMRTGFIIEKAKRELGYAPRSFDEGLAVLASQMNSLKTPVAL